MPFFDFRKSLLQLLDEVLNYSNLTEQNIEIIGSYFGLMEIIDLNFKLWSRKNYEIHPDYENIEKMWGNLSSTLGNEFLGFLEINAKDKLYTIDYNDEPIPITDVLKEIDNTLNNSQPIVQNSKDLRNLIEKIIDLDMQNFIQNEGFYKLIQNAVRKQFDEDMLQKTIKIQLENAFLRRNFKSYDIHREVQNYDDKRPDFLIKSGLIGPIMVELKFLHNPEIKNRTKMLKYKDKIKNSYLLGTNSEFGFYLIFKIKQSPNDDKCFKQLKEEYKDIDNLTVKLIDTTRMKY
jgi:hypothetical protein